MPRNEKVDSTGAMFPNMPEQLLQRLDIQLALARSLKLTSDAWDYRLMSPFWRIYVHDRAGAQINCDGECTALTPDVAVIIPSWLSFETTLDKPLGQHVIHFEMRGLAPSRQRHLLNHVATIPLKGACKSLFTEWKRFGSTNSLAATAKATAFMYDVLASLIETHATFKSLRTEPHINRMLDSVLHQLEASPEAALSNADLAKRCGMSVDHFIRSFKDATGLSPGRYRLELRLSKAAGELTKTAKSIELIAEENGFADRFHFSKAFKKHFEDSPGRYRASHRIAEPTG